MPRYVALEWDNAEARVAVARVRNGHVDLDHALTVPLSANDSRSPAELGRKVQEALKAVGIAGGDAIVAVGRANIELRFLTVPPVPPEELPELVRFSAARQFSQPIEEGLLDFAPLVSSGNPPVSVLAAAISPDLLKTIREVCAAAQLIPKHLVLRPFAADSLVTDRLKPDSCVITVDRLAEEVDLTVVLGGQAVFPRSVRVGNYGTAEEQASTIVAEMRRTLAAAQNQIAGHPVQSVLILGPETEQRTLSEAITRELSLPVEFVDPLNAVSAGEALKAQLPASVGRFAPLIGALLDEARGRRHEIDFLSPRKRPAPPNRKRLYITLGSAAAAILVLALGAVYWQLSSLEQEITTLQDEAKKLKKTLDASKPGVDQATLVDEYAAGQVAWLAELRQLATNLPPGDKVILDEINTSIAGNPRIVIVGGAIDQKEVPALQLKLSDERHRVHGVGAAPIPQNQPYAWSFRDTIEIIPEGKTAAKQAVAPRRPISSQTTPAKSGAAPGRKS